MAEPALVSSFGNNCGAVAGANPFFTYAATTIAAGDLAICVVQGSSTANTLALAGWTISAPLDNTTLIRSWICYKFLAGGEQSTTVTFTEANSRWSLAGGVYRGVDTVDIISSAQQTTLTLTITVPGWTPVTSFERDIIFAVNQRPFANGDGINAWPAGYTGQQDQHTSFTGASDYGAAMADRPHGVSAAAVGATTASWNDQGRSNSYIVTLKPLTATAPTMADAGGSTGLQQTLTIQATAPPMAETGSGVDALAVAATAPPMADTGAGVDQLGVGPVMADSATATGPGRQVLTVQPGGLDDTGTAVDNLAVAAVAPTMADTGSAADALALAPTGMDETGTGVDSLTVVLPDTILLRANTPAAAAADNTSFLPAEPGTDGHVIGVGPLPAGGAWNDLPKTLMEGPGSLLTKTGSYVIDRLVDHGTIVANGASITITLPDPTLTPGRRYTVKNIHSSSASVALAAGTVDGSAGPLTLVQWAKVTVVSDGTQWLTI